MSTRTKGSDRSSSSSSDEQRRRHADRRQLRAARGTSSRGRGAARAPAPLAALDLADQDLVIAGLDDAIEPADEQRDPLVEDRRAVLVEPGAETAVKRGASRPDERHDAPRPGASRACGSRSVPTPWLPQPVREPLLAAHEHERRIERDARERVRGHAAVHVAGTGGHDRDARSGTRPSPSGRRPDRSSHRRIVLAPAAREAPRPAARRGTRPRAARADRRRVAGSRRSAGAPRAPRRSSPTPSTPSASSPATAVCGSSATPRPRRTICLAASMLSSSMTPRGTTPAARKSAPVSSW